MKRHARILNCLLATALLGTTLQSRSLAKSYSSGSHSYSSSSHGSSSGSHSFSSGGSHSSTSGGSSTHTSSSGGSSRSSSGTSTHSSGGSSTRSSSSGAISSKTSPSSGNKTFTSGEGKSYTSRSPSSDTDRRSYTAGKSYSSEAGHTFSSSSAKQTTPSPAARDLAPKSSAPDLTFDTAAARAKKEETSKTEFTRFKDSQRPPVITPSSGVPSSGSGSFKATPPPIPASRTTTYIPDTRTLRTRPARVYNVFNPYYSRPLVVYRDPYDSFFWWWLLDRSLDDRAYWAYHHRYDMDPARYEALVAQDQQLESRVAQLEAQQAPRDESYVPPGLDRDMMYSDRYVEHAYSNRPTRSGAIAFWVLAVPTAMAVSGFFIWLIWFKRWQTAT